MPPSSPSLKEGTAPHDGDGLVHDPFADAEVSIDPRLNLLAFADRG